MWKEEPEAWIETRHRGFDGPKAGVL